MAEEEPQIYLLRIALNYIKPPIWRKVEVPSNFTFYQLHQVIQAAMNGWMDYHLHDFEFKIGRFNARIGNTHNEFDEDDDLIDENETLISEYLPNYNITYVYDFGDNWNHTIRLQKVLEPKKGQIYPRIVGGKRACPPEDCGSVPGYEDLCEKLAGPDCPEKKELQEWLDGPYDPEKFDIKEVEFPPELCTVVLK